MVEKPQPPEPTVPRQMLEAGYETPRGLNGRLYGAIVTRDVLLGDLGRYPDDPGLHHAIRVWEMRVDYLKLTHGMLPDNLLPPEDE